jgi:hypothetical protein
LKQVGEIRGQNAKMLRLQLGVNEAQLRGARADHQNSR